MMMPFRKPPVNGIIYLFVIEYIEMLQLHIFSLANDEKGDGYGVRLEAIKDVL